MPERFKVEAISPILNKVNRFLMVPMIRNIVGQNENRLALQTVMDEGRILLLNLSKGLLGETNSALLGNFLIAYLQIAGFARAARSSTTRRPFTIFVDELQHFASASSGHFETLLAEGRKYGLSLVAACQHLEQLRALKASIFGNVQTMFSYQLAYRDAQEVAMYLDTVTASDVIQLPAYCGYLKTEVHGMPVTVSFSNLPVVPLPTDHSDAIKTRSRAIYSRPRTEVEREIAAEMEPKYPLP